MPALAELKERRLTHSRLACAKTCLRKHHWLYVLGLRQVREAEPLRIGRFFHKGIALFDKLPRDEAILAAVAAYDMGPGPEFSEDQCAAWWTERETIATLLAGWFWRWEAMNAEMKVMATEQVFEIPLRNPASGQSSRTWTLAGRRDKVVTLPDGRLAILECKTTSEDLSPDGEFWKRLLMDSQVSIYWLAALDAGLDVQTVLYDVTRKPSIRPAQIAVLDQDGLKIVFDGAGNRVLNKDGKPRQSASFPDGYRLQTRTESAAEFGARLGTDLAQQPERYFARREIPRLPRDLEEARYELWAWGRILRECERSGHWPRNTAACNGFGRCACWDLCTGGFDPADGAVPEGWTQLDDVHQELVELTEEG
jgi:hypothetical protein